VKYPRDAESGPLGRLPQGREPHRFCTEGLAVPQLEEERPALRLQSKALAEAAAAHARSVLDVPGHGLDLGAEPRGDQRECSRRRCASSARLVRSTISKTSRKPSSPP